MNQYSVLHIVKYKELEGIGAHIDRHHIPENANPDKSGFNEELAFEDDSRLRLLDILGDEIDKGKVCIRPTTYWKIENRLKF